jgi:hypothetical protein
MDTKQVAEQLFRREVGRQIALPNPRFEHDTWPPTRAYLKFPARLASLIAELSYEGQAIYAVIVRTYSEGDYHAIWAETVCKIGSNADLAEWEECVSARFDDFYDWDYGLLWYYYAAPLDLM